MQAYCSGVTVLPKPFKLRLVNREAASVNGVPVAADTVNGVPVDTVNGVPDTFNGPLQTPSTEFH